MGRARWTSNMRGVVAIAGADDTFTGHLLREQPSSHSAGNQTRHHGFYSRRGMQRTTGRGLFVCELRVRAGAD